MTDLVIGCPAADKAWCLPLWFESVRQNVDPAKTGLVFVAPAADSAAREEIERHVSDFAWAEVLRDRGAEDNNSALTLNQLLHEVTGIRPRRYLQWDADFLVPGGTVDLVDDQRLPICTVWAWLNRHEPFVTQMADGRKRVPVRWQHPTQATAMGWDDRFPGRARHYPSSQYLARRHGTWTTGVVLAWKLMDMRAYMHAYYAPHEDGVDVPFSWQLRQRGVKISCCGDVSGVRLTPSERHNDTPRSLTVALKLAKDAPLAATFQGERPAQWEAFGFYPVEETENALV